jgi:hypothetical protein
MFYFLGSLLFALAMMAALAVMASNFAQYRRAMMTALRSLSMDGFGSPPRHPVAVSLAKMPALATVSLRAAV